MVDIRITEAGSGVEISVITIGPVIKSGVAIQAS